MKMSRRALRMEKHHQRAKADAGLSLVSLMDIFTILVFFLLVHSSEVETLPSTKSIRPPESVAENSPKQTVVVTVSNEDILVQGLKVVSVADALQGEGNVIEALRNELEHQNARRTLLAASEPAGQPRAITILADRDITYELLKKIMATCVRASYENISLAVLKRET
jgi:biopolymer transport protein ExbD